MGFRATTLAKGADVILIGRSPGYINTSTHGAGAPGNVDGEVNTLSTWIDVSKLDR
jgi:hypothetical protein